jgi:hypothetical protein
VASLGPPPFTGALESRLNTLDNLGVKMVRFTLVWRQIAPSEPSDPTNPNDPAYDWHAFDPVMNGLHGRRPYAIQRVRHGRRVNVGGWRTGVGGTFRVTVNLARGARVRLRSSRAPWPSPVLVVR